MGKGTRPRLNSAPAPVVADSFSWEHDLRCTELAVNHNWVNMTLAWPNGLGPADAPWLVQSAGVHAAVIPYPWGDFLTLTDSERPLVETCMTQRPRCPVLPCWHQELVQHLRTLPDVAAACKSVEDRQRVRYRANSYELLFTVASGAVAPQLAVLHLGDDLAVAQCADGTICLLRDGGCRTHGRRKLDDCEGRYALDARWLRQVQPLFTTATEAELAQLSDRGLPVTPPDFDARDPMLRGIVRHRALLVLNGAAVDQDAPSGLAIGIEPARGVPRYWTIWDFENGCTLCPVASCRHPQLAAFAERVLKAQRARQDR